MSELLQLSGLEIAERIRKKELSSEELTRFFLERIARHDGQLSSFVTVLRRRALRWAKGKDRQLSKTDTSELPVFHGVPSALKDLVPMRGTPTKLGSRAYRWFVSPFDARVATLYKRGGFVVLGKLATSEFGAMPITEPDIHPPTRNPWNTDYTSGGSSGGTGAAVAAGLLPLAQGSDGGGSIRIPASLCHLYGFKPSLSLVGNLHGRVNKLGMSVMGPLSHTVEDAAAMIDVLRGHAHCHHDRAEATCLSRCRKPPGKLRIRMSCESPIGEVEPEIAEAVKRVGHVLEDLGHRIEPFDMVTVELNEFLPLWQLMLAAVPCIGDFGLQPVTRWLRRPGRKLDVGEVKKQQQQLIDRQLESMGDADVMLTATVPVTPPRVGAFKGLGPEETFAAISSLGALTAPFNISRAPAANIPVGLSAAGLPIGVQIGSRAGNDHLILSLSKQLEEAIPWRGRRAPALR